MTTSQEMKNQAINELIEKTGALLAQLQNEWDNGLRITAHTSEAILQAAEALVKAKTANTLDHVYEGIFE